MARTRTVDTRDYKAGQDQEHFMSAEGSIDRADFKDEFQTVDTPAWKEKAKALAFNEEFVKVVITDDGRPNAEQTIQLENNGRCQFFIRNVPITVRRKYVEILARAKNELISTQEFTDIKGNKGTKIVKQQGLRYPFRVIEDKNPDGAAWLEGILREP